MKSLDSFFNRFVDIEKNRYANLEGIRALAIIMVFNVHLFGRYYKAGYFVEHDLLRNFFKVLHAGHTGVDLFFVLSGFLIFRSLGKVPNLGKFMLKRYHRLWPVVFVTGIALFKSMNNSVVTIFDNFSLLMFWTKEPVNYVNWTLTYEIYFYFFIGFWFFYLRKIKFFQENGIFLFGLLLISTFAIVPGHFIQEPYRFIGFFWGILLAKLHDHRFFLKGVGGPIAKYGWVISFVGIPVLLTWWGVYALASPFPQSWPAVITTILFFMLIQALYFLLLASLLQKNAVLTPLLSSRFMRYLGNISFSFYIVHGIWGISNAAKLTDPLPDTFLKVAATWVLGMVFSIIIASVLYLWLEKPYFTGRSYFSTKFKNAPTRNIG